jgi:hypothetical protein
VDNSLESRVGLQVRIGLTVGMSLRVPVVSQRHLLSALWYVALALLPHGHIQGTKSDAEHRSRPLMAPVTAAESEYRSAKDQEIWAVAEMSFGLTVRAAL